MWQSLLVGLIVMCAASYAIWRLMPAALRRRLAGSLSQWAVRPGRPAWAARAAASVGAALRANAPGCGDCDAARPPPDRGPERGRR